ncbi:MAG: Proline iminopeptidase [Alphaproteobacteria bacterium MarineAlpha9_Bin3]|nr:MAG: Proline iminopeptidase [Alphaproteobacteria bacterium MarineAlpha9_Bin3]
MSMIQDKNFPQPYEKCFLEVGDGHKVYVEKIGNPKGIPFIFLHGGPGSGCQNNQRSLFNLENSNVILFDQRGAGKSEPKRSLYKNTTQNLIADMEEIRKKFNIKKWSIVGGSWGSTLGLAYTEKYRDSVEGLVLRSVFLGTDNNVNWAFEKAAKTFRPELWNKWIRLLDIEERKNPIEAYGKRLESSDIKISNSAALAWSLYESILSQLSSDILFPKSFMDEIFINSSADPNTPFFEWHYIKNNFFLEDNELIKNAYKLNGIPGSIVQGRYDLLCPVINAYEIAMKWKTCDLIIVDEGAHSANSDPMREKLVKAINDLTNKLI